jgi:hypothetical protein
MKVRRESIAYRVRVESELALPAEVKQLDCADPPI